MADKKFRYDTHVHTKEASACARSTGAEMTRAHYFAGYSGIIITDHFFNGNTAISPDLPWEERINEFCLGYEHALKEAEKFNFHVFFGWEYNDRGAEFLTYGLGKEFLLANADMLSWPIEKYLEVVRQSGGFVSQAHPFREASYISGVRVFPELVDAFEVCNASHTDPKFDRLALEMARKYSLYRTSGSDTHYTGRMYGGGMEFDHEIFTIDEFIQAVREAGK